MCGKHFFIKIIIFALTIQFFIKDTYADAPIASEYGTIHGTIRDQDNKPLPGVTVMLKHKSIGAITNSKGEYTITRVPVGKFDIVSSMVGYHPIIKQVTVQDDDNINLDFKLRQGTLQLGTIVVTGTTTEHLIEDSPVHTEVISAKIIEDRKAMNLAEAIDGHTGVQVESNCSNCNYTQVRINGLDGKYSELLMDGDPVFSSLAGVYGLEQIPENMISQIEIVKGGGSALYGGGAVAGVINVISRRPLIDRIKCSYTTQATMGKGDDSRAVDFEGEQRMDHLVSAVAEFVNDPGTSGAFVYGSIRNRNPYDHNGDGFSELGMIKTETIGMNSYFEFMEESELNINFHHIHEKRRGGNDFELPKHEADISEAVESWRWGGKVAFTQRPLEFLDYKVYYSFGLTERESYYGGTGGDNSEEGILSALNAYGKTNNPLHLAGARSHIEIDGQLVTFGLEYKNEGLEDFAVRNVDYQIDEVYTNFGIYLQDNMHFFEDESLELVAGVRMDKHSELENSHFSPRLSVKYALLYGFNLRATYSHGFKAPQPFIEDFHIESMEGKQRVIRNLEGLEPEQSNSFSGGLDYNGMLWGLPVSINLIGFHTDLTDAFDLEFFEEDENIIAYKRVNAGSAAVSGFDFNFALMPFKMMEVRFGVNYKSAEYDEANADYGDQEGAKKFERTPDLSGNLTIDFDLTDDLETIFSLRYMGSAYVPHESLMDEQTEIIPLVESDSYIVLDFGIDYYIYLHDETRVKLSAGVKNILDAYQDDLDWGVERDPAYIYGPSLPRSLFAGIEMDI